MTSTTIVLRPGGYADCKGLQTQAESHKCNLLCPPSKMRMAIHEGSLSGFGLRWRIPRAFSGWSVRARPTHPRKGVGLARARSPKTRRGISQRSQKPEREPVERQEHPARGRAVQGTLARTHMILLAACAMTSPFLQTVNAHRYHYQAGYDVGRSWSMAPATVQEKGLTLNPKSFCVGRQRVGGIRRERPRAARVKSPQPLYGGGSIPARSGSGHPKP